MSELIDNRAHRIRTLKEVITRLHRGEAPAAVRPQLVALVKECDAGEIAAMEQELMADGVSTSEIMRMCDLHAEALRDLIVDRTIRDVPPGHPVDTFRRENTAIADLLARLRAKLGLLSRRGDDLQGGEDPAAHVAGRAHRSRVGRDLDTVARVRLVPRRSGRGLAAGATPITVVFAAARSLEGDDLLEINASFRPVPLVESLEAQGYACHVRAASGGFAVFVKKPETTKPRASPEARGFSRYEDDERTE